MEENRQEEVVEAADEGKEDLNKALEEEKTRVEKYLGNWQRAEADFDNYRKRVEQEKGDIVRFSNTSLILNLLPVLDDMERAFKSLPDKLGHMTWTDGIRLIQRKLQATLEAQGVSEIKAVGESFDPAVHEAVAQGAGEEGKIVEELQKGYKLHGRVIRPAYVVVGKGTEQKENEAEQPDGSGD